MNVTGQLEDDNGNLRLVVSYFEGEMWQTPHALICGLSLLSCLYAILVWQCGGGQDSVQIWNVRMRRAIAEMARRYQEQGNAMGWADVPKLQQYLGPLPADD